VRTIRGGRAGDDGGEATDRRSRPRGSLIAIFEAIAQLAATGFAPKRTILIALGHDEEIGGSNGSVALIGIAEKGFLTLKLTASERGGHPSTPPKQSAIERLARGAAARREFAVRAHRRRRGADLRRVRAPAPDRAPHRVPEPRACSARSANGCSPNDPARRRWRASGLKQAREDARCAAGFAGRRWGRELGSAARAGNPIPVRRRRIPLIRHPLQRLGTKPLAVAMVSLAASFVCLTVILVYTVPPSTRSHIGDLLAADSLAAATAVLSTWGADTYRTFAFLLGFDFLYDVVHNNAVAVFAIWGARRVAATSALHAASATAWVLWLDTLLNIFENLVFLDVVRSARASPLLPVASAIFSFRTATLGFGLLLGLSLHGAAFWRQRASAV
jgi:hypothetical protein